MLARRRPATSWFRALFSQTGRRAFAQRLIPRWPCRRTLEISGERSESAALESCAAMTLTLTPITLREANAYVERHHRHHQPARGCIACVAVADDEAVRGVAIVGRPVARRSE